MRSLLSYLRTAYYLNFLVVVGAVLSNRMVARLSDVEPIHWATPVALALVVFIIYTVDRLLDVRKDKADASSQSLTNRHQFHRRHAALLWRVVVVAAVVTLGLTFFLPGSVVKFGIALGGICAAYVGGVFRLPARHPALLLKEPLVAMLYTVGIWGSVWVQRPAVSRIEVTTCLMFAGIAFQNLLLFSVMERYETGSSVVHGSRNAGPPTGHPGQSVFSLASAWGQERCNLVGRWLTIGVVLAGFLLCFLTSDRFAQRSALMLALMSLMLYSIQRYPVYFLKNERYRWLGDGVFWMPALVL